MVRFLFGVFIVLHGLVHLLYFGQSARFFELQPGMSWPDNSVVFSRPLGNPATRNLASILLILAVASFTAGGGGVLLKQAWWQTVVVGAAVFSSVIYLIFWDGSAHKLDDKGGVGILINLAILAALLIFRWPNLGLQD